MGDTEETCSECLYGDDFYNCPERKPYHRCKGFKPNGRDYQVSKPKSERLKCKTCPAMDKIFTGPGFYSADLKDLIIGRIVREGCFLGETCPNNLVRDELAKKLERVKPDYVSNAQLLKMLEKIGNRVEGYNYTKAMMEDGERGLKSVLASRKKYLNEDIQILVDYIKKSL